eukprot:INCI3609.1.p1 GENE.INCI3609.1~~INCI3609.1.p1  ORF type:complete len:154 (-),score=16.81 INCI3609.1:57-458(-)
MVGDEVLAQCLVTLHTNVCMHVCNVRKTTPLSTKTQTGDDTVATRMMKAMGWREGQTLGGSSGSGAALVTPLAAAGNVGNAGLGLFAQQYITPRSADSSADEATIAKRLRRQKAKARYLSLEGAAKRSRDENE